MTVPETTPSFKMIVVWQTAYLIRTRNLCLLSVNHAEFCFASELASHALKIFLERLARASVVGGEHHHDGVVCFDGRFEFGILKIVKSDV